MDNYHTISPREDNSHFNLGAFVTQEQNYHSPDEEHHDHHDKLATLIYDVTDRIYGDNVTPAYHCDVMTRLIRMEGSDVIIHPIDRTEHSSIHYHLHGNGGCKFDTGTIGFYFVDVKKAKKLLGKNYSEERVLKNLKAELELYTSYANGEGDYNLDNDDE